MGGIGKWRQASEWSAGKALGRAKLRTARGTPRPSGQGQGQDHEHDRNQLERMTFFSDAVFAIAMTLLVVEVRLPHLDRLTEATLAQALLELLPNYIGFLVSFLVLGRFWVSHHVMMSQLRATSPTLVWANLYLLLAVAFMPFPTAVVSEYIEFRVAIAFYAAWLVLLGLLNQRIIRIAIRDAALRRSDVTADALHPFLRASWIPVLIGALAFAGGMVLPIIALAVLVIGSPIISLLLRRRQLRSG